MIRVRPLLTGACLLGLVSGAPLHAVINVGLQPSDLFERHESVLSGRILAVDRAAKTCTLQVDALHKGDAPAPGTVITITATEAMAGLIADHDALGEIAPGREVAAFVGKRQRRRENELMFYAGGFHLGARTSPTEWSWNAGDTQLTGVDGQAVPTMMGTWNGSTRQLIRMLADLARDRAFFPRRGYAAFKDDILIDQLVEPVRGVALYDVDGNGMADVYASSSAGDRLYLQMEPLVFINATEWVGLEEAGVSCSFADFDGDGVADLLAGGRLLRGAERDGERSFARTGALPLDGAQLAALHASAFVEINGDGFPDVVVSLVDGGLRALINPGAADGPFADATSRLGLPQTGTGFFSTGDWNGDGRTDLFHAADGGTLLLHQPDGRFSPLAGMPRLRLVSGPEEQPGLTGAGAFAPLLGNARFDLIVPVESGWRLIENRDGTPVDVTEHGNEISEGSYLHLATITEDFNLDGHVDFYTVSRARNGHNRLIVNRGYGSFMLGDVHRAYERMFSGPAQELGGWGLASGDADGDGQPDLLIGNELGHVILVRNDTLAFRKPVDNPIDDVARLLRTTVVTVDIRGPLGVVGAIVSVRTSAGAVVDIRSIGGAVGAGSRSTDQAFFALREPGPYHVHVRYADGHERSWPVSVSSEDRTPIRVVATR